MSVDKDTVKRVARLARIAVSDEEAEKLKADRLAGLRAAE